MKRLVTFFLITVLISLISVFFWAKPHFNDESVALLIQNLIKTQLKKAGIHSPTVEVTVPHSVVWKSLKTLLQKNTHRALLFHFKIQGQLERDIAPPIGLSLEGPLSVSRVASPLSGSANLTWSVNGLPLPLQGRLQLTIDLDSNHQPRYPIQALLHIPEVHFSNGATEILSSDLNIEAQIEKFDPKASIPIRTNGKIHWKSLELMASTAYRDLGELLPKSWQWNQSSEQIQIQNDSSLESSRWQVTLPLPFEWSRVLLKTPKQELAPWIQDLLPTGLKLTGKLQVTKNENQPIQLRLNEIHLSLDSLKARIQKIHSKIELDPKNLRLKKFQFDPFHLEVRLYKFDTALKVHGQKINVAEFERPNGPRRIWTDDFQLHPLPLVISGIHGSPKEFVTAVHLPPIPFDDLSNALCQKKWVSFPVLLEAQFKSIHFSSEQIRFDGSAQASFFNGRAIVTPKLIDMPLTPARETHLDFSIDHVQLAEFAQYSRFGKIDGILRGYAKNTILRGVLPLTTQFRLEIAPDRKSVIVFNSEAMKNFVRLVAEEGVNTIPGIARWFAFGLPSQLLGGYNIDYVGIELNSDGDALVMDTLDPPVIRNLGQHFILKGPRFKIPLESPVYPVRFDKAGLSLFVARTIRQLKGLSLRNEESLQNGEERNETQEHTCETPDF